MIDLMFGRWQDTLASIRADSVIVDSPYGARTHEGARTTRDIEIDEDDFGGNIEGIPYPPSDRGRRARADGSSR
jgi:hypothetical protein